MSKIKDTFLKFLPKYFQQKVRNKYYEVKISKATEKDEPDLFIVSKMLSSGQVAVDIGANFGLYTKHLANYVGPEGKIHAFEPILKTFLSLQHNMKALSLENVELYNSALSDFEGSAEMLIPDYRGGGENLYEAHISTDVSVEKTESVKTHVLDKILRLDQKISFIKIDVEGHEINVLRGSKQILKKSRPILLIEINGGINSNNNNAKYLLDLLKEFDYEPFFRINERLQKVENENDGFNFFFLTPDHQGEFNTMINI